MRGRGGPGHTAAVGGGAAYHHPHSLAARPRRLQRGLVLVLGHPGSLSHSSGGAGLLLLLGKAGGQSIQYTARELTKLV